MQRALELARLGRGRVAPNPLVGAVVVHGDRILGEGFHRAFGGPHAEVHAVDDALQKGHAALLSSSTLYVNLEPCSHHGKTPPCTDLILHHRIPHVVIANTDPFPAVNGNGIERLRAAGVIVETGVEVERGRWLNRRFFRFHEQQRPWIILKWAESLDGFLGPWSTDPKARRVSGPDAHRLVHRWRSEEAAIAVGSGTAVTDNPRLTVREWPGQDPVRVLFDRSGKVTGPLHLYDGSVRTLRFTCSPGVARTGVTTIVLDPDRSFYRQAFQRLYEEGLQSVLVEGGSMTLRNLIAESLWDEARIFTASHRLGDGVPPVTIRGRTLSVEKVGDDTLTRLLPE